MGSFISSGEKSCKVKYTTDLQFTLNSSNYIFKTLEAVNYKDNSVSMADYVEFTTLESDDKNGIYKIQVKLLKESNDILIRPSCILIPKIAEITPVFESSGCDQDTAVKITFNKPMDVESFGDFSCVSIYADGAYASDYFTAPEFASDNKTLYVRPLGAADNSKLLLAPDGNIETKNITVKVNLFGEQKDCDGISIAQNSEHIYKINKNYGNLKKVNINLEADENMGAFLTSTPLACVVGFSVDVQFKVKKDLYIFKGFETSESLQEKIKFTYESDSESEVQKVRITVLEDSGDITVRPSCTELPKVLSITPKSIEDYPAGYSQDTTITIKFNKPVDTETFDSKFSFLSVVNSSDVDLREKGYFETPVFSEDKTELSIPTVKGKFIIPLDSSEKDDEITLRLNFTKEKDADGYSIPSIEEYKYLINNSVDRTPPELKNIRLAKTKEDAENGTNLITWSQFVNYATGSTAPQNIRNHHVRSVWIYVEASDKGTGVNSFTVTEKFLRDTNGAEASVQSTFQTVYKNESGSKDYSAVFEHVLKCSVDGVVNLSFAVTDYSNNTAVYTQTSDLVKDSTVNSHIAVVDSNSSSVKSVADSATTVTYTVPVIQADSFGDTYDQVKYLFALSEGPKPYIKDMDGNKYTEHFYPGTSKYKSKLTICEAAFSYDNKNFTQISMDNITGFSQKTIEINSLAGHAGSYSGQAANVTFTVDRYKDVYLRLSVKDEAGNIENKTFFFNKSINIVACEVSTDKERWIFTIDSPTVDYEYTCPCVYVMPLFSSSVSAQKYVYSNSYDVSSGQERLAWSKLEFGGTKTAISGLDEGLYLATCIAFTSDFANQRYECTSFPGNYFLIQKQEDGSIVAGVLDSSTWEFKESVPVTDADLPESFTVTVDDPVLNAGTRDVHVSYPEGFTPNPNLIYFVRYHHPYIEGKCSIVDTKTTSFDLTLDTDYCSYDFEIIAYNYAGESLSTSYSVTADLSYDNVPPYIGNNYGTSLIAEFLYQRPDAMVLNTAVPPASDYYDEQIGDGGGSGLYVNADGKVPLKYFYSSNSKLLGNIDWSSDSVFNIAYDPSAPIELPYDGTTGNYLYMYVKDKNGNTAEQKIEVSPNLNSPPSFTYSSSAYNFTVQNFTENYSYIYRITSQYCDGTDWNLTAQMSLTVDSTSAYFNNQHKYCKKMSKNSDEYKYTPTFTDEEKDCYVRFYSYITSYHNSEGRTNGALGYFYPVYAYLPYVRNPSSYKCKLCDYSEGSRGLNIFADNPVLVHTFYCSKNLGDKAEDWLYYGTETGVASNDGSFTYTKDHLNDVPRGKYYATVIHFADGSLLMTDVKQK